jgi:hypothetical protein
MTPLHISCVFVLDSPEKLQIFEKNCTNFLPKSGKNRHICVHIYTYVCICVHMCAYVCICVHMCAYVCICVHIFTYVCICVHMCAYVCICVHMCAYVCICVHIFTYVFICVHICRLIWGRAICWCLSSAIFRKMLRVRKSHERLRTKKPQI